MTPKEKAEELITKFQQSRDAEDYNDVRDIHAAIRCALIAVDEIIKHIESSYHNKDIANGAKSYWSKVRQEIEKL